MHQVADGKSLTVAYAATPFDVAADLSVSCWVLIPINPHSLPTAYELLFALSNRFVLVAEYSPCLSLFLVEAM